MTTETKRKYTAEYKREAVKLVTEGGYKVTEAGRNLGINASMLGRWKREAETQGHGAFPGQGHQSPEQEELRRLREENKRLKLEREILKKAAAFFAKESS